MSMPVIESKLRTESKAFAERSAEMQAAVAQLNERLDAARYARPKKSLDRLTKQGKLTIRQRLDLLLDPGAPYMELSALAADGLYDGDAPQAGMVTGIGTIAGRRVLVSGNDPAVKGGTLFPVGVKKALRAQQIAMENRLPVVHLVDSGGAFLPLQSELFADQHHGGRVFYNQARMSRMGIPQIAVVMGHCTAGGAYMPALSDQVIMVKGTGAIFLGGPPLVKAATGQDVSVEELGGAEMHCRVSGVADYLVENEADALAKARELVGLLPRDEPAWGVDREQPEAPAYDSKELYGLVPVDLRKPYDTHELIARVVDGSRFSEFKPLYGPTLVTGFARIWGYKVGVLANNGVLFGEAALKATQFIQICDSREIPLVFLHNINGFMVGAEVEQGGITKNGAKMINAVANTRVPKFTVVTGGSFGAGNYAMCGRAYGGRFLWMWPHARVSVMGGEQAASVMVTVMEDKARRVGSELDESAKTMIRQQILENYEKDSDAYYSTARIWDDGVIDPADTRDVLGFAIASTTGAPLEEQRFGWMRM